MNGKIEISRELLQKLDDVMYIMTGHDSFPRLVHKYGKDWWNPINDMRGEICTLIAADPIPPPIQTLHANGDLIAMEATISQQAQRIADLERGRREPVAWGAWRKSLNRFYYIEGRQDYMERTYGKTSEDMGVDFELVPLYREQPAPVAVVFPELIDIDAQPGYGHIPYSEGWNDCVAKQKELNK